VQIAIALFDGVEELDFAGPWEVLSYQRLHRRTRARGGRLDSADAARATRRGIRYDPQPPV